MSLVAGQNEASTTIPNDNFWPNLTTTEIREYLRLDGAVTNARIQAAAQNAIYTVNSQLSGLQQQLQAAGHQSTTTIPIPLHGGTQRINTLYIRAVTCAAGAELCERYRTFDNTARGAERGEALTPTIDEYRRDERWAIRDLLNATRVTVEAL